MAATAVASPVSRAAASPAPDKNSGSANKNANANNVAVSPAAASVASADGKKDDEERPSLIPFSQFERPIKGGILVKQGQQYKSWKKRIFLLNDHFLYYYVSSEDKAPRGVIALGGCEVKQEVEIGREKGIYCFSVKALKSWNVNLNKFFKDRTYYFCTPQMAEMNDWMALLLKMSKPSNRSGSLFGSTTTAT